VGRIVGGRDWDWVAGEVEGGKVGEGGRLVCNIVGAGFRGKKGGRNGRLRVCIVEVGGSLGGCKEPVKPFELTRGLGKGRSRVRGDLGGRCGGGRRGKWRSRWVWKERRWHG